MHKTLVMPLCTLHDSKWGNYHLGHVAAGLALVGQVVHVVDAMVIARVLQHLCLQLRLIRYGVALSQRTLSAATQRIEHMDRMQDGLQLHSWNRPTAFLYGSIASVYTVVAIVGKVGIACIVRLRASRFPKRPLCWSCERPRTPRCAQYCHSRQAALPGARNLVLWG